MIQSATSLTSSGLRDWLVQRVSAVILAAYFIFLLAYFILHPHLQYAGWQQLFACNLMRIFTLLALLSLVGHSWIGIWTVITDYIKCAWARLLLEVILILALLGYLFWGIEILWR
jgi:succinate dehydrogenase / fumarate reductase membrane anchor subunit